VRERVRLRTKIKSILTYDGIKPLDSEIKHISKRLRELAEDDEDVKLLMTVLGVGYYTALLVKSEIGLPTTVCACFFRHTY